MSRPDRASLAHNAPLDDLLTMLLRQFRRPLETHGIELKSTDSQALIADAVAGGPPSEAALAVRRTLIALVRESEAVLEDWNLTFETALETGMDAIPGWQSTAEFLEVANAKSNAEIRIAAGSALVAALGDLRFSPYLLQLAARDEDDVDSVVARRVLLFKSGVSANAPDWLEQVRRWLDTQSSADT